MLKNNKDNITNIYKMNRGKKFSKLYNFTKYDRRFFNKMKLWTTSEINLTHGNYLSLIFQSFSLNELLNVNDIIEPLIQLLSRLNNNSPTAPAVSSPGNHINDNNKETIIDNYYVRNFKLFRMALLNVNTKLNGNHYGLRSRASSLNYDERINSDHNENLLELSLDSIDAVTLSPEKTIIHSPTCDLASSIDDHNSYLHGSLMVTNPRYMHQKRISSNKKGQHRIYQLAIKEMRNIYKTSNH